MKSFAFIEFTSIADGLKFTHQMSKGVDANIEHQELMCPGKYVLSLSANEATIRLVMAYAKEYKTILSIIPVFNLNEVVLNSINKKITYREGWNYGVVETRKYVQCLGLANELSRNSTVAVERLIDRLGLFGKGLLIFSGSSSELKNAQGIIENYLNQEDMISLALMEAVKENIFEF